MDPLATTPAFWKELLDRYRDGIAHAFILHGNVRDYVDGAGFLRLQRFLAAALSRRSDLIVQVNPAQGSDFPIPAQRELLIKLLSLPSAPPLPLAQALRQGASGQRHPALLSLRDVSALLDWLLTEALTVTDETATSRERPLRVAVLFDFGELMLPDGELSRSDPAVLTRFIQWAQSPQVGERHVLVIATESLSALHSELRRTSARWEAIELPLPGREARERYLAARIAQDQIVLAPGLTPGIVAQITGGLSLLQIEDVLFRGMGAGTLSREHITERKQTIIRQEFAEVLEINDARFDLGQVGGYEYLKAWLHARVIVPWQQGGLRIGGLLLSGPPGTGKTQLAEALAGSASVPFVVFRLSKILGQYVGNSERNLERALHALLSLAPVLCFIDELDQTLRRGDQATTSGVDNRLFARLLEFLEDPARRGKVLIAAATNRPDLLDSALRSRFDRTIPLLPPIEASDRAAILRTQALAQGISDLDITEEALARTEGWTGRAMRDFMEIVAELVHDDGMPPDQALTAAFDLYAPRLRDMAEMTRLALAEITDLRLLPPALRNVHREPSESSQADTPAEPERRRARRDL